MSFKKLDKYFYKIIIIIVFPINVKKELLNEDLRGTFNGSIVYALFVYDYRFFYRNHQELSNTSFHCFWFYCSLYHSFYKSKKEKTKKKGGIRPERATPNYNIMSTPDIPQEDILVYPKDLEDICVFWEIVCLLSSDEIKKILQRLENDVELRGIVKGFQKSTNDVDNLTNPLSYIGGYLGLENEKTSEFIKLLKK